MPHGRYNLLRKIADGGTAEVFLAHMEGSAGFQRLVVLKRVLPRLWADESFRKMLIDEAHISMALHHSNIVQVLDLGLSSDRYFLAFELVDGWTLSQVVNRAKAAGVPLPLNLALHVLGETCRALAYAHSRTLKGVSMGIVHRDVTPQNVLISEQGEVKLADFGIAKARTRLTVSAVGQVKGKPAFMSPEQAQGFELDARSDLFAVGVMLYWLAVGELPFSGATPMESLAKIVRGNYPPPETKRPDLPPQVAKLITHALEGDVKKRFQSADELLEQIETIERKVLEPAGQSELKRWLAALAAKDGARPIGRAEDTQPPAPADTGPIELVDEGDIVVTAPPQPAPLAPAETPVPRERRGTPWLRVVLLLGLLGGGAWWWLARPDVPAPVSAPASPSEVEGERPSAVALPPPSLTPPPLMAALPPDAAPEEGLAEPDPLADAALEANVEEPDAAPPPELDAGVARPVPALRPPVRPLVPAAAAKDETMISVLVESEPAGANVAIDNHVFGKTPIPLKLKIGIAFKLVVSKPGFKTQEPLYFVTRRPGQRVRVTLVPGR